MPDARAPDGVQTVTRHGRGARRALWIALCGDLSRIWTERVPGPARSGAAGSHAPVGAPDGRKRAATSGTLAWRFPGR
jgi:hypothetical protein